MVCDAAGRYMLRQQLEVMHTGDDGTDPRALHAEIEQLRTSMQQAELRYAVATEKGCARSRVGGYCHRIPPWSLPVRMLGR